MEKLETITTESNVDQTIINEQRDKLLCDIADRLYCEDYTLVNYKEFYNQSHGRNK